MQRVFCKKNGFSLVEVMAVVAIIGILSAAGFASLQNAVANNRIKDAAINISAYMERTANEARRVNDTLCVRRDSDQKLVTFKGTCATVKSNSSGVTRLDSLLIDPPVQILTKSETSAAQILGGVNFEENGAQFIPRIGLSAAPYEGFFGVQYGGKDLYGAAAKVKTKNSFTPMIKYSGDGSWVEL
jgi:prepilin-type N-terminal cleavage/methylation domain-containing protein